MEGTYRAGLWLAEDKRASSILLDAAIYSNLIFIPKETRPEGQPTTDKGPTPHPLKESLWTLNASFIPNSMEEKGTKYPMEPDGSQKGISWTSILASLEATLGVALHYDLHLPDPPPEQVREAQGLASATKAGDSRLGTTAQYNLDKTAPPATGPTSTPEETTLESSEHTLRDKYIGTSGITVDNAGEAELDILKTRSSSQKAAWPFPSFDGQRNWTQEGGAPARLGPSQRLSTSHSKATSRDRGLQGSSEE